jgi:hypothetical protein
MSLITTVSNYGGRIGPAQSTIKQFISSTSKNLAIWVYKTYNLIKYQTPENKNVPVLIENDLIVEKDLTVMGAIFNPSDIKLKQNIISLEENYVEHFLTLNPIIFNYINDEKQRKHYGFLAQDVEKFFPELVTSIDNKKFVNYNEMIPLLHLKIKQLNHKINELEKTINC